MDKRDFALISFCLLIKKKRKKRLWHKPYLGDYERSKKSFTFNLEPIVFNRDSDESRHYVRMDKDIYMDLLNKVTPLLFKNNNTRLAITPREKLSLTLSFLAEGLSLRRLSYEYRVGVSTASVIIEETISSLNSILVPEFLRVPKGEEWKTIASDFQNMWNFPNCLGALDGKHVMLYPPRNSGSLYFNCKEGFSIVLLALVDANYKFIAVDIGANGRCSDSGIWAESGTRKLVQETCEGLGMANLPFASVESPFVILGDSGFPLEKCLMRPYPDANMTPRERIYNYRLSRARRVSENAFGILANRWRILLQRMLLSPEKATAIVTCCCALHNLLCSSRESQSIYYSMDLVDNENIHTGEITLGLWRNSALESLPSRKTSKFPYEGKVIRERLKHYFSEEGKVSWQENAVCLSSPP